jgi:hypothetical protein
MRAIAEIQPPKPAFIFHFNFPRAIVPGMSFLPLVGLQTQANRLRSALHSSSGELLTFLKVLTGRSRANGM